VIELSVIAFAISIVTGPATGFVFLYAQDVVHLPGYWTALMVVIAGAAGLFGLLGGRWMADELGRRPTCTVALIGACLSATLAYSGSRPALVVGYTFGVLSGSILAPAVGSLLTELFPTSVRASVTGWWVTSGVLGAVVGLVAFGTVADVGNRFALAAALTFLPMTLAAGVFWLVPETRGKEPEMLWPDEPSPAAGQP
jgi:putative MFS transporter